jgi:predicted glutamine amidotransferase
MCGLLGYSGKQPFNKEKLRLLFYANETRGRHSAGFYNENKAIVFENRLEKTLGEVSEKMLPTFEPVETSLFIGHTRAATLGEKTIENAHPFLFGNVIGAHNGTLKNHKYLISNYNKAFPNRGFDDKNINMDSKIFFHYINEVNSLDIVKDFDGAAALIWRDARHEKDIVNIWRNYERPLHYGYIDDGMYISSEKGPLAAIGCVDIKSFDVNKHYEILDGKILSETVLINSPKRISTVNALANFTDYKNVPEMVDDILEYLKLSTTTLFYHDISNEIPVSSLKIPGKRGILYKYKNGEEDKIITEKGKDNRVSTVTYFDNKLNTFIIITTYLSGTITKRRVFIDSSFANSFWDFIEKKRNGLLGTKKNDKPAFENNFLEEDDDEEDDGFVELPVSEIRLLLNNINVSVSKVINHLNDANYNNKIIEELVVTQHDVAEFLKLVEIDETKEV